MTPATKERPLAAMLDDFAAYMGLGVIVYLIYFGLCVVGGL